MGKNILLTLAGVLYCIIYVELLYIFFQFYLLPIQRCYCNRLTLEGFLPLQASCLFCLVQFYVWFLGCQKISGFFFFFFKLSMIVKNAMEYRRK